MNCATQQMTDNTLRINRWAVNEYAFYVFYVQMCVLRQVLFLNLLQITSHGLTQTQAAAAVAQHNIIYLMWRFQFSIICAEIISAKGTYRNCHLRVEPNVRQRRSRDISIDVDATFMSYENKVRKQLNTPHRIRLSQIKFTIIYFSNRFVDLSNLISLKHNIQLNCCFYSYVKSKMNNQMRTEYSENSSTTTT